jgi:outer membrane scaffolding protein for murein synthesis (MipA/OmpV family)
MQLSALLAIGIALVSLPGYAQETLIGAGVRTRPEFDGFSERKTDLVPVLRYYGRPWFARTTQGILEGGARWNAAPGLDIGAQLAYEQGPLDKDPGASIGVHAEWDRKLGPVPIDGLVRVRQHLDSDRGMQADFRVTGGLYEGHGILAGAFGQFTLASEKYYRAYYAVDESGLLYTSLGALASYDLARRWRLLGSVERRHMSDNAARSALVVQRSASYGTIGLAYRF